MRRWARARRRGGFDAGRRATQPESARREFACASGCRRPTLWAKHSAQIPDKLVVFTVDIADAGHGVGLTPAVAAAVPEVIKAVLEELGTTPIRCR